MTGSGVQARSHVRALRLVRSFSEIRVWSPNQAHVNAFVDDLRREWAVDEAASTTTTSLTACSTAADAVRDADVIVTATLAKSPILTADCVKVGAHINAVGAPRPDQVD